MQCKQEKILPLSLMCVKMIVNETWFFELLRRPLPVDVHNGFVYGWSYKWHMINHDFCSAYLFKDMDQTHILLERIRRKRRKRRSKLSHLHNMYLYRRPYYYAGEALPESEHCLRRVLIVAFPIVFS